MNAITLAIASIRSRVLHAGLCTISVMMGVALLCAIFLFSQNVAAGFARNAQGIDMIVGTKGSPLQLVLSSVYHADIPAGNITMNDYEDLKKNPRIRQAIPLALGDNFKGFRMVGTTLDYLKLYNAEFANGRGFAAPFETVAGADTGLRLGDKIALTHGFAADGDDVHDEFLYTITGVLKPTGTVLDKLLTTQIRSVQQLHEGHHHHHHHHHEDEDEHEHGHDAHEEEADRVHQITSVLLNVRSPVDLMNMPRHVNESSNLMAAVPSYEMARFAKSLGIGRQLIMILGAGFVLLSAFILWATLSSGLALRRYDLAVLRVLGATPWRLFHTVIAEALLISGVGALAGVVLGHVICYVAVISIESLRGLVLPEALFMPQAMDVGFVALGLGVGLLAALVPAVSAARTNIAGLLARGVV